MSPESLDELREKGYRLTPQRLAILSLLQQSGRHMTPVEIVEEAKKKMPGITEATVYRTLDFLSSCGLILAAHIGSGQLVYESGDRLHHHLICRNCGQSLDIEHAAFQSLYRSLEESSGFIIDCVHVTLFGLCPECKKIFSPRR